MWQAIRGDGCTSLAPGNMPHMWPKVQSALTCTASGTHHCQTLKVVCTFLLHSCQTWKYSSLASDVHITSWKYRVAGPRWQIWRECLLMLSHCTRADTGQVEARWAVCSPVSTEIDVAARFDLKIVSVFPSYWNLCLASPPGEPAGCWAREGGHKTSGKCFLEWNQTFAKLVLKTIQDEKSLY